MTKLKNVTPDQLVLFTCVVCGVIGALAPWGVA